jgi:hypothetical protein
MDTIWNCAFGIDIDVQNNPENEYFTKCEKVFANTEKLEVNASFLMIKFEYYQVAKYLFFLIVIFLSRK